MGIILLTVFVFLAYWGISLPVDQPTSCGGTTKCVGTNYKKFLWSGHCYCIRTNLRTTDPVGDGEDWCSNDVNFGPNAHVTSITSRAEEDFIHDLVEAVYGSSQVDGREAMWICLRDDVGSLGTNMCSWDDVQWWDGVTTKDYKPGLMCNNACCTTSRHFYFNRDQLINIQDRPVGQGQYGVLCKYKLYCNNTWAGDEKVCSSHGACFSNDLCNCDEGWTGETCGIPVCYNIPANETETVCDGHGTCHGEDACDCEPGYSGNDCSTELTGKCHNSNERHNGWCYQNHGDGRDFESAESYCVSDQLYIDSHLVSLHNSAEESFVNANIRGSSDIWLGLRKIPEGVYLTCPPSSGYYWTDGTSDSYALDESPVPNCDSESELCMGISEALGWEDFSCSGTTTLDTVCKFKIPICYGTVSYEVTTVCSGRGQCVSDDNCDCTDDYYGDQCEKWDCYGVGKDSQGSCSSNGVCISPDICVCDDGYGGVNCNLTSCNGIPMGGAGICSGRGTCVKPNLCHCDQNYAGDDCEYPRMCMGGTMTGDYCFEKVTDPVTNQPSSVFQCTLWDGALPDGKLASILDPNELAAADTERGGDVVFTGLMKQADGDGSLGNVKFTDGESPNYFHGVNTFTLAVTTTEQCLRWGGTAQSLEDISCGDRNNLYGYICKRETPYCYEIQANDPNICSGRGICYSDDNCLCSEPLDYYGPYCNQTYCNFIESDDPSVCSGKGECYPKDTCTCDDDYHGDLCEITTCFGEFTNESACSGHGHCFPKDTCVCDEDYYGRICNITVCEGLLSNNSDVCNGHGDCKVKNLCSCDNELEYFGDDCEKSFCEGIPSDNIFPRACNGKGTCDDLNHCDCDDDYYGDSCNITTCEGYRSDSGLACFGVGWCYPKDFCTCPGPPYIGDHCEIAHPCNSPGEYPYNGYCYKREQNVGDWNASEHSCQKWFTDGHLMSIWSYEESQWIKNKFHDDSIGMFIGAQKRKGVEVFLYPCPLPLGYSWSDFSSAAYYNSLTEGVIQCDSNGTCLYIIGSSVKDVNCMEDISYDFGCKYEIPICFDIPANDSERVCNGHGYCFADEECSCVEQYGWYGLECEEHLDPLVETYMTEFILHIPYQVEIDITAIYPPPERREIVNEGTFTCSDRILNSEVYEGGGNPVSECWWEVEDGASVTTGIAFQVGFDSLLFNLTEDGKDRSHPLKVQLMTDPRNITVYWVMKVDVVLPPPPPPITDDDDDGNVGGVIAGAVAGGLAASLLALILAGGVCGGLLIFCFLCCTFVILMLITVGIGCGVLFLVLCTGTTAATTAGGAVVVGKEVHDEVMDEGPDFVTDAVKERVARKERGETIGGEIELDNVDVGEEFITDNLQDDILRNDDNEIGEEGLDTGKIEEKDDDADDDGKKDDGLGIDLEGSSDDDMSDGEKEAMKRREEEYQEKLRKRREKEAERREKEARKREERERVKFEGKGEIKSKMEELRKKEEDDSLSLTLGTRYARKKGKVVEKKLKKMEKELEKEHENEVKKIEKEEGFSLSLRRFEKRKKKKKKEKKERIGGGII